MESIPCLGCSKFFTPRNRAQMYCSEPKCQKKRKAIWQKTKKKKDPEYLESQKLSQEKWLRTRPDYWKKYRERNPKKTERNRLLQKIRNRRLRKKREPLNLILVAKMDTRKSLGMNMFHEFWFVPAIAKMDAAKINFHLIPYGCE